MQLPAIWCWLFFFFTWNCSYNALYSLQALKVISAVIYDCEVAHPKSVLRCFFYFAPFDLILFCPVLNTMPYDAVFLKQAKHA